MHLTPELWQELLLLTCPHCARNDPPIQRPDSREWIHNMRRGAAHMHSLCLASGLRNSKYASLVHGRSHPGD